MATKIDTAERGRAAEKRHAAAKHRQRGMGTENPLLERGREVERSHNRIKNKARWRKPERDRTEYEDDQYAAWRKRYYRQARPDLDPQSTASSILEFFGLDEPYRRDAGSFDYRREVWDESVRAGKPDRSWSGVLSDEAAEALRKLPDFFKGGDQVDNESGDPEAEYESRVAAFLQEHAREPDEDEKAAIANEVAQRHFDPRSRSEKMAALALNVINYPTMGAADEIVAGTMSMLPGRGTYDEELAKARQVQANNQMWEQGGSPRTWAAMGASLPALFPLYGASSRAAEGAWSLGRKALGMSPKAKSVAGRATTAVGSGAAGFAAPEAGYGFGSGDGDFANRVAHVDPDEVATSAALGGVLFPAFAGIGSGVAKGAQKVASGGRNLVNRLARDRRSHAAAPDNSVRGDINRAFARHATTLADDAANLSLPSPTRAKRRQSRRKRA